MDVVSSITLSSLAGAVLFFTGGRLSARPRPSESAELEEERARRARVEREAADAWNAQREAARAAEAAEAKAADLMAVLTAERAAHAEEVRRSAADLARTGEEVTRLRAHAAAMAEELVAARNRRAADAAKAENGATASANAGAIAAANASMAAAQARAVAAEKRVAALSADVAKLRTELGQAMAAKAEAMRKDQRNAALEARIAELVARVAELEPAAREVEELRHRIADLEAMGFADRITTPPPPSRPAPDGASLATVLERELGRLVDREGGCRLAVLADPRGLLIAASPGAAYPQEVAAASSLTTYASERLRELLPLGPPASLELYDENGLCVRTRWIAVDSEQFLVCTIGVVDTHDPEALLLRARIGDAIGAGPTGGAS